MDRNIDTYIYDYYVYLNVFMYRVYVDIMDAHLVQPIVLASCRKFHFDGVLIVA